MGQFLLGRRLPVVESILLGAMAFIYVAREMPRSAGASTRASAAAISTVTAGAPTVASIGTIKMNAERRIELRLRADGPNGERGESVLTYDPGDTDYDDVIKHVGGISPGETKAVPPWPEPT
jgi:hypothetical protein